MNKLVNGVIVKMTPEEVQARREEEATADAERGATEYQRARQEEYPSVGDQLEAIWEGGAAMTAMRQRVADVRDRHPRPQESE